MVRLPPLAFIHNRLFLAHSEKVQFDPRLHLNRHLGDHLRLHSCFLAIKTAHF